MNTSLWIVIALVTGIVGFLMGYSVASYTGARSAVEQRAAAHAAPEQPVRPSPAAETPKPPSKAPEGTKPATPAAGY